MVGSILYLLILLTFNIIDNVKVFYSVILHLCMYFRLVSGFITLRIKHRIEGDLYEQVANRKVLVLPHHHRLKLKILMIQGIQSLPMELLLFK